jgi:hypothetical protein
MKKRLPADWVGGSPSQTGLDQSEFLARGLSLLIKPRQIAHGLAPLFSRDWEIFQTQLAWVVGLEVPS